MRPLPSPIFLVAAAVIGYNSGIFASAADVDGDEPCTPSLDAYCGGCQWEDASWRCDFRVKYMEEHYNMDIDETKKSLMREGECIDPNYDMSADPNCGGAVTRTNAEATNSNEEEVMDEAVIDVVENETKEAKEQTAELPSQKALARFCKECIYQQTKMSCEETAQLLSYATDKLTLDEARASILADCIVDADASSGSDLDVDAAGAVEEEVVAEEDEQVASSPEVDDNAEEEEAINVVDSAQESEEQQQDAVDENYTAKVVSQESEEAQPQSSEVEQSTNTDGESKDGQTIVDTTPEAKVDVSSSPCNLLDAYCGGCQWEAAQWRCDFRIKWLMEHYHMTMEDAKMSMLNNGDCIDPNYDLINCEVVATVYHNTWAEQAAKEAEGGSNEKEEEAIRYPHPDEGGSIEKEEEATRYPHEEKEEAAVDYSDLEKPTIQEVLDSYEKGEQLRGSNNSMMEEQSTSSDAKSGGVSVGIVSSFFLIVCIMFAVEYRRRKRVEAELKQLLKEREEADTVQYRDVVGNDTTEIL